MFTKDAVTRCTWEEAQKLAEKSDRFLVLGGPGGRLATVSADRDLSSSPCRDWAVLFKVNRPLTPSLRDAAVGGALRHYELA